MDRKASTSHDILERMLLDESAEPTNLPLSLLEDITNCFSLDHQIGSGGFAVVYKGLVGKSMVAVKKLFNTFGIHENKFQEEVKCLIKAKHKNIVRFLGYCADTQGKMEEYEGNLVMADQRNWLLCFEYVRNGSLDKHITGASSGLNWRDRYRIIRGISEGLLFLHEKRIIHLDLKPANILLDGHMVPKIADFGLSRCLSQAQTRAITKNICGTPGYMDPEYLISGEISFASDIYSLGVIIMEIVTGERRYLEDEHVVENWMNRLEVSEGDMQLEQVRVCTEIAIECMALDPKKRPVLLHIIDRLDKMQGADNLDETGIISSFMELQVNLPREESGERIGKLAGESLQKEDMEDHSEGADNLDETGIISSFMELQVNLPREESGERIGKLAGESLQKEDMEDHSEILDVDNLGRQILKNTRTDPVYAYLVEGGTVVRSRRHSSSLAPTGVDDVSDTEVEEFCTILRRMRDTFSGAGATRRESAVHPPFAQGWCPSFTWEDFAARPQPER